MAKWNKILLLLEDQELRKELETELASVFPSLLLSQDDGNYLETIIIADEKNLKEDFLKNYSLSLLLISSSDDKKNVTDYLLPYQVNHLFGANAKNLVREIKRIITRMTSPSVWGPAHFLADNAKIVSIEIQHSKDIQDEINKALDGFEFKSFFETPADYIKLMANELLTNAFYHILHTSEDRTRPISLNQSDRILFQMALDDNYLAISVKDTIGTLDREGVVKSIERGLREKTVLHKEGGAGIGLYLTFSYSNQLIINQVPLEGTEIICVIDVNRRFKHYKERVTSFHFHKEG